MEVHNSADHFGDAGINISLITFNNRVIINWVIIIAWIYWYLDIHRLWTVCALPVRNPMRNAMINAIVIQRINHPEHPSNCSLFRLN